MCILFLHVDPNPKDGDYRLIIATNRDEYYQRPAQDAAAFDGSTIIGGKDMEPGREGGMWLGFTTKELDNGKGKKYCAATLLNITGARIDNPDSRGIIVKDYLESGLDFNEYTKTLEDKHFNGFNLVSVELSKDGVSTFSYSNSPKIFTVYSDKQTLGFGNSPIYSPLTKVTYGSSKFEEIVKKRLKSDHLVEELLRLLKDQTSHLPDEELKKRCPITYQLLSPIFVKIEQQEYGTRAHTIILIDYDWNLQFIEHALEQPINIKHPKWNINKIKAML